MYDKHKKDDNRNLLKAGKYTYKWNLLTYIKKLEVGKYRFQRVGYFIKYLGVTVNGKNERSTEISERIKAGNKTYWKYSRLLKYKTPSKTTKLRIYKTEFRLEMSYTTENLCLTYQYEEELRIQVRKMSRSIPKQKRKK